MAAQDRSAQLAGCEDGGRGHGLRSKGKEAEPLERKKPCQCPILTQGDPVWTSGLQNYKKVRGLSH